VNAEIYAYCSYGTLYVNATIFQQVCGSHVCNTSGSDVYVNAYYTGTFYEGARYRLRALAATEANQPGFVESIIVPGDATLITFTSSDSGVTVTAGSQSQFHAWITIETDLSGDGNTKEIVLDDEEFPDEMEDADTTQSKWAFAAPTDYPAFTLTKVEECGLSPTISVSVCDLTVECDSETEHLVYDNGYPEDTPFYGLGVSFGEICGYVEDDTGEAFCYEAGETTYRIARLIAFISNVSVNACSESDSVPIMTFRVYLLAYFKEDGASPGDYAGVDWRSWDVTARGCDPTFVVTPVYAITPTCEGLGLCWPSPLPTITASYAA
jgi:hypothetical protein